MVHSIGFKKRCNNCFQADGITQKIIIMDHSGKFLDKFRSQEGKSYDQNIVLEHIKNEGDQVDRACEICGNIGDFVYYDLEVDNSLLGEHSALIKGNEKKLILNHSTLTLPARSIHKVNLTTDDLSEIDKMLINANLFLGKLAQGNSVREPKVNSVQIEKLNLTSLMILIDQKQIKIAYGAQDNSNPFGFSMQVLFVGHITGITYDAKDQIQEIKGVIFLSLYGGKEEQDFFVIKRNVENIYSHPIPVKTNLYLEIPGVKHKNSSLNNLDRELNNYLIELL